MEGQVLKKVSVIMPCYNDGAYIEEAAESVWAQTYPNVELIIIDDGSDDGQTAEILAKLADKGAVLLHTSHLGPAGARNAGISAADGEYILPVDADDRIDPTYIEKAVEVMDSDDNVGVVYCHADLFGEQSGPWKLPDYSLESMLLDNIVFVTSLFRKADWLHVGGFSTVMENGMEDYDFWLSILEIGREIRQLPETLFHYRIKPVSRTTRFLTEESVVQETYRQIYQRHPVLYERYKHEYATILRDAFIHELFENRKHIKQLDELAQKKTPLYRRILDKLIK